MKNINIFDVGERFLCVVRRLITCPSDTPLSIGGIRDDIRGIVLEGFEMSDVCNVLVLCDEVADCVNIFYISPLDVGLFHRAPSTRNCTGWGPFSRFLLLNRDR